MHSDGLIVMVMALVKLMMRLLVRMSYLEWPGDRDGLYGDLWGAHPASCRLSVINGSLYRTGERQGNISAWKNISSSK